MGSIVLWRLEPYCAERDATMREPDLLPRTLFFLNPDRANPALSPDGTQLSYLAPWNGVMNIWLAPTDYPQKATCLTKLTGRGVGFYHWSFNNSHIVYSHDLAGDENWQICSINIATSNTLGLTPRTGVNARVVKLSRHCPDEVIIGLNSRSPHVHDLYRVNILSGTRTLVQQNPGNVDVDNFAIDYRFNVRFVTVVDERGSRRILRKTRSGFLPFVTFRRKDLLTSKYIDCDDTGRYLYFLDSRNRNTAALLLIDLKKDTCSWLAHDSECDIDRVVFHPRMRTVQAATSTFERRRWHIIDPTIQSDIDQLSQLTKGDFWICDRSMDDSKWLVEVVDASAPVSYCLYERKNHTVSRVYSSRSQLARISLPRVMSCIITARDDQKLVSYLTLPRDSLELRYADQSNRPPMVVIVHGGPWARDYLEFHPAQQWLANRGYAVLRVNYRGSTGFGKAFIESSRGEWGGKMQNDLIDAVNWAVNNGFADKDRIGIMGSSFGGYAALMAIALAPDVFACGVDLMGPTNLVRFAYNMPKYWGPLLNMWKELVGDFTNESGRQLLLSQSPSMHASSLEKPLLICHGARDARVNRAESDQFVQSVNQSRVPIIYVVFPDEGHSLIQEQNRLAFFAMAEKFLAQHLGGRLEPIEVDLAKGNFEIVAGAHYLQA